MWVGSGREVILSCLLLGLDERLGSDFERVGAVCEPDGTVLNGAAQFHLTRDQLVDDIAINDADVSNG